MVAFSSEPHVEALCEVTVFDSPKQVTCIRMKTYILAKQVMRWAHDKGLSDQITYNNNQKTLTQSYTIACEGAAQNEVSGGKKGWISEQMISFRN